MQLCPEVGWGLFRREHLRDPWRLRKEKKGVWNSQNREQTSQSHQGGTESDLGSKHKVVQCPWGLGRTEEVRVAGEQIMEGL